MGRRVDTGLLILKRADRREHVATRVAPETSLGRCCACARDDRQPSFERKGNQRVGGKTEPAACRADGCGFRGCGPVQCARLRASAPVRKSPDDRARSASSGIDRVGTRAPSSPLPPPSSPSAIKIAFSFLRSPRTNVACPTLTSPLNITADKYRPCRNTRNISSLPVFMASCLSGAVDSRHDGLTKPATSKGPEVKFRINNCTLL